MIESFGRYSGQLKGEDIIDGSLLNRKSRGGFGHRSMGYR